jgi:GNAT superfamily N-acetyltransferase
MRIDHVRAHEADRLRELRLTSLQADPHAFGATYESDAARPPDWWERGARQSDAGEEQRTFVVAADDGRWLGMALVRPDDETPGEAVLNAMWVAPEARGRGNARALCDACAQWAAEHGFSALLTAVVVGNEAARRTYESAGFTFERTDTWTGHGRTLEEIVLRRPLQR